MSYHQSHYSHMGWLVHDHHSSWLPIHLHRWFHQVLLEHNRPRYRFDLKENCSYFRHSLYYDLLMYHILIVFIIIVHKYVQSPSEDIISFIPSLVFLRNFKLYRLIDPAMLFLCDKGWTVDWLDPLFLLSSVFAELVSSHLQKKIF